MTDEAYLAKWGPGNYVQRVIDRELIRYGIAEPEERYQFPDNDRSEGYAAACLFFCSLDVNRFEQEVKELDSWPIAALRGAAKSTALTYMQTKRLAIYKKYLRSLDK